MSSATSSSTSSSPSPSPKPIQPPKSKKSKEKSKGKNPHWAYKPPAGCVLIDDEVDAGEFDWDTVKEDADLELWLVRAPEELKPKYLERLQIDVPPSSRNARIGILNRKQTTYDVWNVGDGDDQPVGGEEVKELACLLPRSSKRGRLYRAPKPITRHILVCSQPAAPAAVRPVEATASVHQNPPRFSYPDELLKHKFVPYGSRSSSPSNGIDADIEMVVAEAEHNAPLKEVKEKGKKSKKRKGDAGSPKTSKKAKTES